MEPVGVEPTSKHLPTYSSTTIGYEVHFITHSNQIKNVQFDKKWLLSESDNLSLDKESYITSEIFIVNEDNILISETFGMFDIDKFISDVEFNSLA